MASLDSLATLGFLFPRDAASAEAVRSGKADETTHLDLVDVPQLLQMTIRGSVIRKYLVEAGSTSWPTGELSADQVAIFVKGLRQLQKGDGFLKQHCDIASRLVSWLERAMAEDLGVWLTF